MRAGDKDRQAVADQLKTALDEGRLDLSEYDERLQKTYGAKTFDDLKGLLDDLPGTVPVEHSQVTPVAEAAPVASPVPGIRHQVARWLGPYAGVILVCTLIWLITSISAGRVQYYWPVWLLIPAILGVAREAFGGDERARRAERDARKAERRERRGR